MKKKLDFVVIGAQKAGTTSLFEYLRHHPEISLPADKEVPYFSHDRNYSQDWSQYLRKVFPSVDPSTRWGTVTTHYMAGGVYDCDNLAMGYDPRTVPARIKRYMPDVLLIASLRDPVERAFSHYLMLVMDGREHRSFADAVRESLEPGALAEARRYPTEHTSYIVRGEYGRILSGYLDTFDRRQMMILFSDDLRQSAERTVRCVFEFLEVTTDYVPPNLHKEFRVGAASPHFRAFGPSGRLNPLVIQRALARRDLARLTWRRLPERTRHRIDTRVKATAYRIGLWNRRVAQPTPRIDEGVVNALREHYAADTQVLIDRFNLVPPWMTEQTRSTARHRPERNDRES